MWVILWVQLSCLVAACSGLPVEELMGALAGRRGGNRVTLCLWPAGGEGGQCSGVIWREGWVLARASCLEGRAMFRVIVLRDCVGYTCKDLDEGREVREDRKVRARLAAPGGMDLALVALSQRYWHLDHLANYSTALRLLSPYTPWMEQVCEKYPMYRRRLSYVHKSSLFSSPLRMFMTTILVPTITFIAIFVYVIFFTGSDSEIPYKNIKCEESETSVKCA